MRILGIGGRQDDSTAEGFKKVITGDHDRMEMI